MIEEILLQYGAIGACLVFFMWFFVRYNTDMKRVIENNTIAVTKVYEVIEHCPKVKRKV
jgi:hypothetical protein